MDFQKNAITSRFSKNAKSVPWIWIGLFLYKILWSVTSRHYSSDAKEANILIVVRCFKIGDKLVGD